MAIAEISLLLFIPSLVGGLDEGRIDTSDSTIHCLRFPSNDDYLTVRIPSPRSGEAYFDFTYHSNLSLHSSQDNGYGPRKDSFVLISSLNRLLAFMAIARPNDDSQQVQVNINNSPTNITSGETAVLLANESAGNRTAEAYQLWKSDRVVVVVSSFGTEFSLNSDKNLTLTQPLLLNPDNTNVEAVVFSTGYHLLLIIFGQMGAFNITCRNTGNELIMKVSGNWNVILPLVLVKISSPYLIIPTLLCLLTYCIVIHILVTYSNPIV